MIEPVIIGDATLYCGDCLDLMKSIPDGSVDFILCDLPYGTTQCAWDSVIPFAPLWAEYRRIAKPNAAIVLTASQPFTTDLIQSNRQWFRYSQVWLKNQTTGWGNAKKMPLRGHEDVVVFYGSLPTYNPQKIKRTAKQLSRFRRTAEDVDSRGGAQIYNMKSATSPTRYENQFRYPDTKLEFSCVVNRHKGPLSHPTQKPVALMEYLIRTYTNEGDTVLDNCMGSGTTGVAAIQLGRKFVGIEREPKYFDIACKRIEQAYAQGQLFEPAPAKREQVALL